VQQKRLVNEQDDAADGDNDENARHGEILCQHRLDLGLEALP